MKKILTLSVMLAALALQANATIWRVNNNLGVDADFTTVTAAVTNAAAGDTIYVEGSATTYAGITLTKKLTIIGTGYFLSDTANHKTEWNTHPAYIISVSFDPGSKGSVLSGMQISNASLDDSLITIERCYFTNNYIYLAQGANTYADHDTIRQCALYGIVSNNTSSGYAREVMIYNNIIFASTQVSNVANTTAYFINNIFSNSFNCENCVFENNIFWAAHFGAYGTSNYFANNIFTNTSSNVGVPTGNNNLFSISTTTLFIASNANISSVPTGFSHDGEYQLAATSPAIGAGSINGVTVDCGAFGGSAPYILSGMPNIPSIYSLTVPAQVNNGTQNINISLSAASH